MHADKVRRRFIQVELFTFDQCSSSHQLLEAWKSAGNADLDLDSSVLRSHSLTSKEPDKSNVADPDVDIMRALLPTRRVALRNANRAEESIVVLDFYLCQQQNLIFVHWRKDARSKEGGFASLRLLRIDLILHVEYVAAKGVGA